MLKDTLSDGGKITKKLSLLLQNITPLLRIQRGPGIGKSTMASYFVDELMRLYSMSVICCFFAARLNPVYLVFAP